MTYTNAQKMLNHYRQIGVQGGVTDAHPHRLIQLLLAGALERIAGARHQMRRGDLAEKGRLIGAAAAIVAALRDCLDLGRGAGIAANLAVLYEYINRRLLEANLENDEVRLVEASRLLAEIQSGWDAIAPAPGGGTR